MTRTRRQSPITQYSIRQKPTTTYDTRTKPHKYISRLRDENTIVCNEDGRVVYIFANSGIEIPTLWKQRKKLLNS